MKRKTIRDHKDFRTSLSDYKVHSYNMTVRAKKAKIPGDARYGVFATKRVFKLAVNRNRAKRMLRDWIAFNEDLMLPDLDYIFVAEEPMLTRRRDPGRREMGYSLSKIAYIHKKRHEKSANKSRTGKFKPSKFKPGKFRPNKFKTDKFKKDKFKQKISK